MLQLSSHEQRWLQFSLSGVVGSSAVVDDGDVGVFAVVVTVDVDVDVEVVVAVVLVVLALVVVRLVSVVVVIVSDDVVVDGIVDVALQNSALQVSSI